jgi:hypothetical protein
LRPWNPYASILEDRMNPQVRSPIFGPAGLQILDPHQNGTLPWRRKSSRCPFATRADTCGSPTEDASARNGAANTGLRHPLRTVTRCFGSCASCSTPISDVDAAISELPSTGGPSPAQRAATCELRLAGAPCRSADGAPVPPESCHFDTSAAVTPGASPGITRGPCRFTPRRRPHRLRPGGSHRRSAGSTRAVTPC